MTERQQALGEEVQKQRSELLSVVVLARVGDTASARLTQRFRVHSSGHYQGQDILGTRILIQRTPDGYQWQEDSSRFARKGASKPKWRQL